MDTVSQYIKMDNTLKSGIYRIVNKINGKGYVGSAIVFIKRWRNHKSTLNRQIHKSILLQRAWNKYGSSNFIFEIIEVINNPTKELLEAREQYWMDFYQSYNPENGYNINRFATSSLGRKVSDETKKKISNSLIGHKGHPTSPEHLAKLKKLLMGNTFGKGNKGRTGLPGPNKGISRTKFVICCSSCGNEFKQKFKGQQVCSKECRAILRTKIQDKSKNIDLSLLKKYIEIGLSSVSIAKKFNLSHPTIKKYCKRFFPELVNKLKQNGIVAMITSGLGRKHTEEAKKKISEKHIGLRHTPEVIEKIKATKALNARNK